MHSLLITAAKLFHPVISLVLGPAKPVGLHGPHSFMKLSADQHSLCMRISEVGNALVSMGMKMKLGLLPLLLHKGCRLSEPALSTVCWRSPIPTELSILAVTHMYRDYPVSSLTFHNTS